MKASYRQHRLSCGTLVAACLAVLTCFHQPVRGESLEELLDGAVISVSPSIEFFDWQLLSLDSTAAPPSLDEIEINPLTNDPANPGLQFVGNGHLSVNGINSLDLTLKFGVQILGNSNTITAHSLTMTGITFGGNSGIAYVSNQLNDGHVMDVGAAVAIADNESDVFQLAGASALSPQSYFFVTTNIFLTGLLTTDSLNLATLNMRFNQTGPPILPGDYDQSGTVDTADYALWAKVSGTTYPLPNAPPAGTIGPAEYNLWRTNFGRTVLGSGAAAQAAVPEPACLALILLGLLGVCPRRTLR
jgi:hypothetical protein